MGFAIPLDSWLRTTLRDMTSDLLLSPRARQVGYLRQESVRRLVNDHMSGAASHGHRLWALLMLQLWHDAALAPASRRHAPSPADSHDIRSAAASHLSDLRLGSRTGSRR
jgi:hypothetical protein